MKIQCQSCKQSIEISVSPELEIKIKKNEILTFDEKKNIEFNCIILYGVCETCQVGYDWLLSGCP